MAHRAQGDHLRSSDSIVVGNWRAASHQILFRISADGERDRQADEEHVYGERDDEVEQQAEAGAVVIERPLFR
jgi:hypothetical protein